MPEYNEKIVLRYIMLKINLESDVTTCTQSVFTN